MLDLLTTLEFRSLLKGYKKTQKVVMVVLRTGEVIILKVKKLGLTTFFAEVFDEDEQTWLSVNHFNIGDVRSINEDSTDRFKVRMICAEKGRMDDVCPCCGELSFVGEGEFWDDEDDCDE